MQDQRAIGEGAPHEGPLLGGVELGGTKCICVIGTGPGDVRMRTTLPTGRDAHATLSAIEAALRHGIARHGPIRALGIASFGPIELARGSPAFGTIGSTVKPGWSEVPVAERLARAFLVPLGVDTDVNAAALAEGRWGAAAGLADFAYVTVGTGIGVGLVSGGRLVHGFGHPELGHLRIARKPGDDWPGACPYHGDCVEGLACGPALAARTGLPADRIPADHPVWDLAAHALGQLLQAVVLAAAPRRILVGGGVAQARPTLIDAARAALAASLNGYLDLARLVGDMNRYVIAPGLGAAAGPLGALALALDAATGSSGWRPPP